MASEENGFIEYLHLQNGKTDLVTKSELINTVRELGYSLGDRQLTFYVTEGIMPRSVRVGSRAGAYPAIVVELMTWILQSRDEGVPLDALRELLPVWKYLIQARSREVLDLGELEYIARQHVSSVEGSSAVPRVISQVMTRPFCPSHRPNVKLVYKDGTEKFIKDSDATIGFAIVRTVAEEDGDEARPQWYASTRITLARSGQNHSSDPTTVILGVKPNAALPEDEHDETRRSITESEAAKM